MDHIIYFLGFVFLRDAIKPWFPVFRDTQLLLEWALTSSVLILIVLAVRRLFKEKLSARLRYALWGVVLLRLLVPFQVQLPAAAGDALPVLASNLAPEPPASWEERDVPVFPGGEVPIEEAHPYYQAFPPGYLGPGPWSDGCVSLSEDGKTVTPYADIFTRNEVIQSIWWVGTLGMAAALLVSNLRFFIRLEERRKQLEVPDPRVRVYVAEGLPSPCLFGVFKPAVYVTPEAAENPDTLRHVLAHELTHYAHKDHLWSLLRCLALALHWYNPLVWLAVVLSKGDGELACDEGAVARLGEEERIPYGRTLVDMVAARSLRPGDLLSCSTAMTGGGKSVKRRVAQIVKKPETVKAALFAVIALVALSAVFVFTGRAQPQPSPTFLSLLEQTTAIRYIPTVHSSRSYPVPITDEDLLAQAKERLATFTYLSEDEPYPDLSGLAPAQNPKIVLTCGEQETVYTLMWQNNYTYLFPGDLWEQQEELRKEEGETAQLVSVSGTMRSRPGDRVFSALSELALYQSARPASSGSPELDQFFSDLERAQSIFVGQPMISSAMPPGLISSPAVLSQARDLLRTARAPIQLPEGVTWEEFRNSLSTTEYQNMEEPPYITQDDLEEMLFLSGCSILLYPGPEPTPDVEYRYFLSRYKDGGGNVLLQWDAELEEEPIKLLATFPDDVYSQLAELARNAARYEDFLDRVRGAVSIQIEEGTAKSSDELGPITDPEWLEQARAALLSLAPLPDNVSVLTSSSEEELRHEAGSGLYAITLTDKAGETVTCYIDRRSMVNIDYLVFPMSDYPAGDSQETARFYRVGVLPGEAGYTLHLAAKVSNGVLPPPTGYAKPDLTGTGNLVRTDESLLRDVLLGQAQFQFVGEDGTICPMDIRSVPSLFSPSSSYAALGEFAVVDLDGDGEREVVVHTADVGNDLTGYLVLRRENGEIYGYPSGWRTFWNLKTDGTFDYSLWNGSEEGTGSYRFDRSEFSSSFHNRLVLEKHFQAEGPGNGADLDTLVIDGKGVTEEAYQKAVREQEVKPDAAWYDFTEVNIRAMFP